MIINLSTRELKLLTSAIKDQKNWYKTRRQELTKKENGFDDITIDQIIKEHEELELKLKP